MPGAMDERRMEWARDREIRASRDDDGEYIGDALF